MGVMKVVTYRAKVHHGQDAHKELHARLIEGHGLVVAPLGPPELVVGGVELGALGVLVGEGLGGAHPGDGGLHLPVDAGQLGLDLDGGLHHLLPGEGGKEDEDGNDGEYHQGQLPLDGKHDAEGPQNGHRGDEQVLRAVVGQLGNLKEVAGDPAHQLAGAILVVEGEGQVLHMGEQVPANVGLHPHPQQVAPVGDDEVEYPLEHIGQGQGGHDGEEGGEELVGQQGLHGPAGHHGEEQVHNADQQGAHHIQQEQLPVGLVIGGKNSQIAPVFEVFLVGHDGLLSKIRYFTV